MLLLDFVLSIKYYVTFKTYDAITVAYYHLRLDTR